MDQIESASEKLKLSLPKLRGDPLLRQLEGENNFQILNLEPPSKLTNIFEPIERQKSTMKFPSEDKTEASAVSSSKEKALSSNRILDLASLESTPVSSISQQDPVLRHLLAEAAKEAAASVSDQGLLQAQEPSDLQQDQTLTNLLNKLQRLEVG